MIFLLVMLLGTLIRTECITENRDHLSYTHQEYSKKTIQNQDSCVKMTLICSNEDGNTCPPGLFCVDGYCKCGAYPKYIMKCNGTNSLLNNYCATFVRMQNIILMGTCLFNTKTHSHQTITYNALPRNASELNEKFCGPYNRTGIMCGRCIADHYPLAYSYELTCIPCSHTHWNWFRYISAAYIPLTFFCILIIFFKINTTSSHLFPVVFYCQTITMPVILRSISLQLQDDTNNSYYNAFRTFFSLYGIWNLDFFRLFYTDICLGIGILPTLALDYAIAMYPLILTVLSYLIVHLHDKNYRVVVILFHPFKLLFMLLRQNWNIRTSIIDAFATFFILSNIKFISISFDMLIPVKIYEIHQDHYNYTYGLFYAPDIKYFGRDHLPYGILAIVMLSIFSIFPAIFLALYPLMCFQKFLNLFPVRWYILHTFADAFYGCYKDGTQPGTRDYRWCSSVFFVIRVLQFLLYFDPTRTVYNLLITIVLVLYTTLFAVLQPFKSSVSHFNGLHIIFLQALTIFSLVPLGISISEVQAPQYILLFYVIGVFTSLVPFLYFLGNVIYWIYSHKVFAVKLLQKIKVWRSGYNELAHENEALPDRINNSGEYHRENLSDFSSNPSAYT